MVVNAKLRDDLDMPKILVVYSNLQTWMQDGNNHGRAVAAFELFEAFQIIEEKQVASREEVNKQRVIPGHKKKIQMTTRKRLIQGPQQPIGRLKYSVAVHRRNGFTE